jgi:predicted secreted Zn-dependent protease
MHTARAGAPRGRGVRALVLLAGLLAGGPALAAVQEQHTQRPYAVHVQPGETLRQALSGATPIRENGKRFHGYTRWNVRWSFRWWREASGSCRITEVTTRLTTEVQLPELRSATAAQRAVFERYERALSRHEEGHVQFGRDAAQAIDRGIAALPEAADCATLEREANALGHRLLREHAQREKDYDRSTGHGASQGARLD